MKGLRKEVEGQLEVLLTREQREKLEDLVREYDTARDMRMR